MSRVLTANDICARSLRAIGKFPVTDTAPDAENLREAMYWLDMILAETVGTERMFKRVDNTLTMPITNGTQSYNLNTTLGSSLPADGIEFVTGAWLQDSAGNRFDVEIVTREKFESVRKPAETGQPKWVYIDRNEETPTLQIFPTPASTDPTVYSLKLVAQRFAPNVSPAGVTGAQPQSAVLHAFGQAWQRWIVCQLAHDLGSGPIMKLPEPSLQRFAAMAGDAKQRLLAKENREQETTPPVCDPFMGADDGDWGPFHSPRGFTDYGNRW